MAAAPISEKKWDGDGVPLKDSNCAGIGTQEDKDLRKAAAKTEEAWVGCGQKDGVEVWRIEKFKVVAYPKESYGNFYAGDSYIVLHTHSDPDSGKLLHHIHFWLGKDTTTDEMGTAAYKTVELDDFFDQEPTQTREVMEHESEQFKKLFPHIQYLEGGVDTGFHHVAEGAYQSKLLQVRKTKAGGVRVKEVTLARESLNQGDCFILDMGAKIYVWEGSSTSPAEKVAANQAAEGIEAKRDGKAEATHDIDDAFWTELGGEGDIAPADAGTDDIPEPDFGEGVLYKLSDEGGDLTTEEVGRRDLGAGMLDSDAVMMLDTGAEIFLWVGKGASGVEKGNAMATASAYLRKNDRPMHTPVHMYKEESKITNAKWNEIMASGPATDKTKAKPPAPAPAPEPAAPAPAPAAAPTGGPYTLAQLSDSAIWHGLGVDAKTRHLSLSDEEFQKVFGMDKAAFGNLAKWKQDSEKKKHGLF